MNWLIWLLLGLFLGVIIGFIIKKPKDTYNYIVKRIRAKNGSKIDISDLSEIPSERGIIKSILKNPEKDRKKLIDRIKERRFNLKNN